MKYHCYGCTNRYPGCHSACKMYQHDSEIRDRMKQEKRKQSISMKFHRTFYTKRKLKS